MSAAAQKNGLPWRGVLIGFGIVVLLIAFALSVLLFTGAGLRTALTVAEPMIPGELSYDSIDGSIAGPVRIDGFDYRVADMRIQARTLAFNFAPSALLSGRIAVNDLDARDVRATLPPPGEEPADGDGEDRSLFETLSLPVHLDIDNASIRDAVLRDAAGKALLELARLNLSLDWNERHLAIDGLDAAGPALRASGFADIGLREGEDVSADLELRWTGEPLPIAGELRAEGSVERVEIDATLNRPANARLDAVISGLAQTPRWQGTLSVEQFRPEAIRDAWPDVAWSGNFSFEGNLDDTHIDGDVAGGWPPLTDIDLSLAANVNTERARITQLEGNIGALDAHVSADGVLNYADRLDYRASGRFSRVSWPGLEDFALRDGGFELSGDAQSLQADINAAAGNADDARLHIAGELGFDEMRFDASIEGGSLAFAVGSTAVRVLGIDGSASGTPQDYRVQAELRAAVDDYPPARMTLDVHGDTEHLVARIESLDWLKGNAQGRVRLAWRDALQLDATLDARGLNLDALDPQLAGEVGGRISLAADFAGEQPDIAVNVTALSGEIAGTELTGKGNIRYANGRITTQGLTVTSGPAELKLDDAPGGGFDFRLQVLNLSRFHARLAGSINATGRIAGELASPTLKLTAHGENLAWQSWQAGMLELEADIDNGAQARSSVQLRARDVQTPVTTAEQLQLTARGTLADHHVEVSADGAGRDDGGELEFAAHGGWQDGRWRGDIGELAFQHPLTGRWSLAEPGEGKRIVIGPDTLRIPEHCLGGPQGRACLGPVEGTGDTVRFATDIDALPIGVLAGWLPPGLDYEGMIDGRVEVSYGPSGLSGELLLTLTPGGIRQTVGEGYETLLGWESGRATVNFDGRVARGELNIDLAEGGRITGEGRLDIPAAGPMVIDAGLQARIDSLQLLPSLVPELSRVQGTVTADLDISGPLRAPRIHGQARLRDGSARVLALGTDWDHVELTLNARGREITGSGAITSGEGYIEIELSGRDAAEGFRGRAKIRGENFKAIHTPEANVNISPELGIELQGRDLYIDGDVFVPFARIEPRDLATAERVSDDQVIVNAEAPAGQGGPRVHVAVTTRLGDDVRIEGFGLTARLEGRVTVAQKPGSPATGTGKLVVAEGQYKAYGQDLTIVKGELIYTGQRLSNPGLDVRAERRPEPDVMVGVAVRGPLAQPSTKVYSDPPMSETAALAYLLFGRSVEQATGEEESQINEAAVALGLGGQKLLGRVGERLGVEEVRVEQVSDPQRASLVLGKYLSPDLYVSYGIGLYEAVNTFRIRYRISSKWTLEATSGLKSSADFVYTIER